MTGWICRLVAVRFQAWRAAAARQAHLRRTVHQLVAATTLGRLQRCMTMWRWWAARQRYMRQVSLNAPGALVVMSAVMRLRSPDRTPMSFPDSSLGSTMLLFLAAGGPQL